MKVSTEVFRMENDPNVESCEGEILEFLEKVSGIRLLFDTEISDEQTPKEYWSGAEIKGVSSFWSSFSVLLNAREGTALPTCNVELVDHSCNEWLNVMCFLPTGEPVASSVAVDAIYTPVNGQFVDTSQQVLLWQTYQVFEVNIEAECGIQVDNRGVSTCGLILGGSYDTGLIAAEAFSYKRKIPSSDSNEMLRYVFSKYEIREKRSSWRKETAALVR